MTFVLVALLALAPFLHGHIGASHLSGFHVDGIDLHAVSTLSTPLSAESPGQQAQARLSVHDDESPAIGVAASLPKSDDETASVWWTLALAVWITLARLPAPPERLHPSPSRQPLDSRVGRAGWPPPALAPPSSR